MRSNSAGMKSRPNDHSQRLRVVGSAWKSALQSMSATENPSYSPSQSSFAKFHGRESSVTSLIAIISC